MIRLMNVKPIWFVHKNAKTCQSVIVVPVMMGSNLWMVVESVKILTNVSDSVQNSNLKIELFFQ